MDWDPRTLLIEPDAAEAGRLPAGVRPRLRAALLALGLCGTILACYAWGWGSTARFFTAFDRASDLFADFNHVYYPTASQVLESRRPGSMFFYSAFFALLCRPLTWLPLESAALLWGIFQVLAFLFYGVVPAPRLLRLSPLGTATFITFCLTSTPMLHNYAWGQVSVFITLLVLAAFHAHAAGRPILAGVLLAFATSIKYYPLLFASYFLLRRDWRMLAAFTAAGLFFFVAVPMVWLSPAEWFAFHRQTGESLAAFEHAVARDINSQYLGHVLKRLTEGIFVFGIDRLPMDGFSRILGLGVFSLNLYAIWRLIHQRVPGETALAAAALFLSLPFLVKTCWPHYFAYLPFCQALLGLHLWPSARTPGRWRRWALGGVLASAILTSVLFFHLLTGWQDYCALGAYFAANALLLPGLYGLAFTAPTRQRIKRPYRV